MGKFSAGHAPNIIPQEAVIEGTIRTFDRDVTALILRRIGEIADATARAFRGSASVEELASAPPLKNDEALTEQMARCAEMLFGEKSVYRLREGGMGSEDFASYTYELPCAYLLLGAGGRALRKAHAQRERRLQREHFTARERTARLWRDAVARRPAIKKSAYEFRKRIFYNRLSMT